MKLSCFGFLLLSLNFGCRSTSDTNDITLLSRHDPGFDISRIEGACGIVDDTMYIKIHNPYEEVIYLDRYGEGEQRCLTEGKILHYTIQDDRKVIPYSIGVRDFFGSHFYDTIIPNASNYYLIDSIAISHKMQYDEKVQMSELLFSYRIGRSMRKSYFKLLLIKQKEEIKQADFSLPANLEGFILPISS